MNFNFLLCVFSCCFSPLRIMNLRQDERTICCCRVVHSRRSFLINARGLCATPAVCSHTRKTRERQFPPLSTAAPRNAGWSLINVADRALCFLKTCAACAMSRLMSRRDFPSCRRTSRIRIKDNHKKCLILLKNKTHITIQKVFKLNITLMAMFRNKYFCM